MSNVVSKSPKVSSLPTGWTSQALGELADVTMGNSPPGESYNEDGRGVPLVNGPVEFSPGAFGSTVKTKFTTKPTKMCQKGDFLICVRGSTTGRTNVAAFDACIGRGVAAVRAKGHQQYLNHFVRTLEKRIHSAGTGSTFPSISQKQLNDLLVPIPTDLSEQKRIAEILDRAEALRAKRRAALALLDELTQSIFLDMFGDPVSNPRGWTLKSLGSVAEKITDGEHLNPVFSDDGMPIVMAGDVLESGVSVSNCKMVSWSDGERFRKKCGPDSGDVLLVSRGATIGRQCVVSLDSPFCLMGSVILIKTNREFVDPVFSQCIPTIEQHTVRFVQDFRLLSATSDLS